MTAGILAAAAGCGSSGDGADAAAAGDSSAAAAGDGLLIEPVDDWCAVLSDDEFSAAVGWEIAETYEPQPGNVDPSLYYRCEYSGTGGEAIAYQVLGSMSATFEEYEKRYEGDTFDVYFSELSEGLSYYAQADLGGNQIIVVEAIAGPDGVDAEVDMVVRFLDALASELT